MHAMEGRPLFAIVTGKISIREDEDYEESKLTLDDVYEELTNGVAKKVGKVLFNDSTGWVYEVPVELVSIASKGYFLIGYGRSSLPVILVIFDLLHPTRRPEDMPATVRIAMKYLSDIVYKALPEDYRDKIYIDVVDTRAFDAPFSLDIIEYVSHR